MFSISNYFFLLNFQQQQNFISFQKYVWAMVGYLFFQQREQQQHKLKTCDDCKNSNNFCWNGEDLCCSFSLAHKFSSALNSSHQ